MNIKIFSMLVVCFNLLHLQNTCCMVKQKSLDKPFTIGNGILWSPSAEVAMKKFSYAEKYKTLDPSNVSEAGVLLITTIKGKKYFVFPINAKHALNSSYPSGSLSLAFAGFRKDNENRQNWTESVLEAANRELTEESGNFLSFHNLDLLSKFPCITNQSPKTKFLTRVIFVVPVYFKCLHSFFSAVNSANLNQSLADEFREVAGFVLSEVDEKSFERNRDNYHTPINFVQVSDANIPSKIDFVAINKNDKPMQSLNFGQVSALPCNDNYRQFLLEKRSEIFAIIKAYSLLRI